MNRLRHRRLRIFRKCTIGYSLLTNRSVPLFFSFFLYSSLCVAATALFFAVAVLSVCLLYSCICRFPIACLWCVTKNKKNFNSDTTEYSVWIFRHKTLTWRSTIAHSAYRLTIKIYASCVSVSYMSYTLISFLAVVVVVVVVFSFFLSSCVRNKRVACIHNVDFDWVFVYAFPSFVALYPNHSNQCNICHECMTYIYICYLLENSWICWQILGR